MVRPLLPIVAVAALLAIGSGCGEDESALCQSLQDLQSSVQALRNIELDDTSAEELQGAADEIQTDVDEVQVEAEAELGQEADTFEATVQALVDDVEALSAEGELTRETLAGLATSVSSVATAFETLQEAAPDDCNLD